MNHALSFCALMLLAGLTACAGQPYVFHEKEFNRGAVDFGKDPTDIERVTICYSSSNTTPDIVRDMAIEACGKFGKTARFVGQNYKSCPMVTPVSANYECDDPDATQQTTGTYPYYFQN